MASFALAWMAYDMRLMMATILKCGQHGRDSAVDRLQEIPGRPLRSYANFVKEATAAA